MMKIPIRNRKLPQEPRVFDVTIDTRSKHIVRVDIQNIRGKMFVEREDVIQQIDEALNHIENIEA